MRFEILAFYGGPDQVMTATSGVASVLGLLLIFWNKVVTAFFRMIRFLRRAERSAVEPRLSDTDSKSAS